MTTAEIFKDMKQTDAPADLLEEMKDLFERADFVKFAKFTASDEENASALPVAVRFVTSTYQTDVEEEMEPVVEADDAHSTVTYATYIVKQATIEAALIEVEKYMQELETKRRIKEPTAPVRECVIAIQKAAPIKINGIIPEQFAAAYVEE
jgi:hypothetical protein